MPGTAYSVTFTPGLLSGGTVAFTTAPAAGVLVTLLRKVEQSRSSDLTTSGPLSVEALNSQVDKLTAMVQDLTARRLDLPGWVGASRPYPLASQPGAILGWDGDGQLVNQVLTSLTPAPSQTTPAVFDIRDYKTAGNSWTTALGLALAAATSAGGGTVLLTTSFVLDSPVYPDSFTAVQGLHPGITVQIGQANVDAFKVNGKSYVRLQGFRISGSGITTGVERAVHFYGGSLGCQALSLGISNTRYGIQIEGNNNLVDRCDFSDILCVDGGTDFGGYAILCDGGLRNIIQRCQGTRIGRHFVYLSAGASHNKVLANYVVDCYNEVFTMYSRGESDAQPCCDSNLFAWNTVENVIDHPVDPDPAQIRRNGFGFSGNFRNLKAIGNTVINAKNYSYMIVGDQEGTPTNVHLVDCSSYAGAAGPTNAAIYCEGSNWFPAPINGLEIVRPVVVGGASYGIQVLNATQPNLIGGRVSNTTDFSIKAGAGCFGLQIDKTKYDMDIDTADATGTITAKKRTSGATGTITSGTTVLHGLGSVPAVVQVTPTLARTVCFVTNRTMTGFDVTFNLDDGNAAPDQPIMWEAIAEYGSD
jgi:hypothetical protein